MKLALVHDWVVAIGGAERCLEVFHELWPEAPLFTLVCSEASVEKLGFSRNQEHTSFIQKLRKAEEKYRSYLPFFPLAIEQFDLSGYNVSLSSSHCAAKGVITRADQVHICYCHTPVRYAWDLTHQYLRENNLERGIKATVARAVLHYIRMWDVQTANRVDKFLANSRYTAKRIWRAYRREADVVYPQVDISRFEVVEDKENYFLFLSRLVPYKKADLVVEAFTEMGLPLVVAGDGPQMPELKRIAGKNVELLGYQTDERVVELVSRARALIFAADEDFGIVPVEAQAAGTPVIAYGKDGVRETVISAKEAGFDRATGVFFHQQKVSSLTAAVNEFLRLEDRFDRAVIRKNAERFSRDRFKDEIKAKVMEAAVERI
ncbi:MAG: glycosyltransferase family 4 protein [Syntrophothermus sp.]|uniref:glycosyltransferase family 4 protein n=1 Tax=Syntrophothermus sp. TaxID=2736299 RepID=UPI00258045F8|nr:glycosyltransferase family 4 protein [Syntrophothermus sp.]NSW81651.1 glycosyltransferase family 4 protein [Syntrophothermus sp.]